MYSYTLTIAFPTIYQPSCRPARTALTANSEHERGVIGSNFHYALLGSNCDCHVAGCQSNHWDTIGAIGAVVAAVAVAADAWQQSCSHGAEMAKYYQRIHTGAIHSTAVPSPAQLNVNFCFNSPIELTCDGSWPQMYTESVTITMCSVTRDNFWEKKGSQQTL